MPNGLWISRKGRTGDVDTAYYADLCHHGYMPAFEQVPVAELPDDFTNETNRILLDIREPDEWQGGHVRGALHIPLGQVPERIDEIDPDAEVFVICRTSGRSFRMLEYFEHVGRDAVCVEGGMVAWESCGKPVEMGE